MLFYKLCKNAQIYVISLKSIPARDENVGMFTLKHASQSSAIWPLMLPYKTIKFKASTTQKVQNEKKKTLRWLGTQQNSKKK